MIWNLVSPQTHSPAIIPREIKKIRIQSQNVQAFYLMKRKPCKIWNFYDGISRRGKSSREPKAPFALLRAQTYRKGAQRGQTADPISLLLLECVLAAGEHKKYKSQKET